MKALSVLCLVLALISPAAGQEAIKPQIGSHADLAELWKASDRAIQTILLPQHASCDQRDGHYSKCTLRFANNTQPLIVTAYPGPIVMSTSLAAPWGHPVPHGPEWQIALSFSVQLYKELGFKNTQPVDRCVNTGWSGAKPGGSITNNIKYDITCYLTDNGRKDAQRIVTFTVTTQPIDATTAPAHIASCVYLHATSSGQLGAATKDMFNVYNFLGLSPKLSMKRCTQNANQDAYSFWFVNDRVLASPVYLIEHDTVIASRTLWRISHTGDVLAAVRRERPNLPFQLSSEPHRTEALQTIKAEAELLRNREFCVQGKPPSSPCE